MAQSALKESGKIRNVVGTALRKARLAKGLSQEQLVAKLQMFGWDIGRTTWTKIELGQRTLTDCELIAAADVLGVGLGAVAAGADRASVRRILRSLRR